MCTPRKNNSLYVGRVPPPNVSLFRRPFFRTPLARENFSIIENPRENNGATCKGDPWVVPPPYTLTEFTEGGSVFDIVTGGSDSSSLGSYEIKNIQLIKDGDLFFFWVYISDSNVLPPFGESYGLYYLDENGEYKSGFAIKI